LDTVAEVKPVAIDGTAPNDNRAQIQSYKLAHFFWHQWILHGVKTRDTVGLVAHCSGPEFLHIIAVCAINRAPGGNRSGTMIFSEFAMQAINNLLRLPYDVLVEDMVTEFLSAEKYRTDLKGSAQLSMRSQESMPAHLKNVWDMFPVYEYPFYADFDPPALNLAAKAPQVEHSRDPERAYYPNPASYVA
jgi:hypothetical protein